MKDNTIITVIVPVNKPGIEIQGFLETLAAVLSEKYLYYEVLLVDDTHDLNTELSISTLTEKIKFLRYIRLSRSYGREICIFAGLETSVGDFVVIMDAETDPPSLVPGLVSRCARVEGILTGISDKSIHSGMVTNLVSFLFHAYMKRYLHLEYRENSTDFRVLSRQVVNAIIRVRDKRRHIKVFSAGMGTGHEYFTYSPSNGGHPRIPLYQRIKTGFDIIFANSKHPLRIASRVGIIVSLINFLYIGYILGIFFLKSQVAPGWTTTSMQMTVMFFFLFLILAVLCEYVGLILEEAQDRPLYQVLQEKNSSVLVEDSIRKNIVTPGEE